MSTLQNVANFEQFSGRRCNIRDVSAINKRGRICGLWLYFQSFSEMVAMVDKGGERDFLTFWRS